MNRKIKTKEGLLFGWARQYSQELLHSPMLCQRLSITRSDIQKAADLIRAGELVAFPTETVYGLGALGLNESAILKIFEAKNRPAYNPLILHVASAEKALELLDLESPELFWQLANQYWPGPLTIVAPKAKHVPYLATGGLDKVAVRVPAHPVALELLTLVDSPVVAPSANASQRPSSTTAEHVLLTLGDRISAVLDAGPCEYGLESTVIDITQNPPVILRPGALILENLSFDTSNQINGSPGRLDKHYAPLISEIKLACLAELEQAPENTAFLLHTPRNFPGRICEILPNNPVAYGKELFAAFYRLEALGVKSLWIEELPQSLDWTSARDRITRALS
ncbi:MAG: L-threonylcarbamoyladenylate synthase [Myxococcaceae bacterium]